MKRKKFKFTALLMAFVCTFVLLGGYQFAKADENDNKVRIIVLNNTYSAADGAVWDGTLLDVEVEADATDTLQSLIGKAFDENNITSEGLDMGYITSIQGLSYSSHPNGMGGFMIAINDWCTSEAFTAYGIASGNLKYGDIVTIEYSTDWGADIRSDWMGIDTSLLSLSVSDGELDSEFNPETKEYVLTLTDAESVSISASALNRNYQVRIYKNDYTPSSDDYYRTQDTITVADGDTLWVGVGDPSWPTMNFGQEASVYKFDIGVKTSRDANSLNEEETEKVLATLDEMYESTYNKMLDAGEPVNASIGGEWMLLSVKRSVFDNDDYAKDYYGIASKLVKDANSNKLSSTKATENARVILALNALGYSPESIEGFNLYEPLLDADYATRQGVNGAIWSLIALDSKDYTGDRTALLDAILSSALETGAFTFDDKTEDADITAMAIMALAKYKGDEKVNACIEKALDALSRLQGDDASFGSVETNAQVLMALSTLGIDCTLDSRFIKNNLTVIDAIAGYYLGDGTFAHSGSTYNQMATEQALLGMDAYKRMKAGKSAVYDMSDVAKKEVATPATGDNAGILLYLVVLMASAGTFAVASKRRLIKR